MISSKDQAFELLVNRIKKQLFVSAYTILRNRDDAMDAVQQAVYIAYSKFDKLKNQKKFNPWIAKITLNEAYKIYNKRKKCKRIDCVNDTIMSYYDSNDIEFFDMITSLNKIEQEIIILRFYYDFSLEEISHIQKLPLSTVKSKLYRTLEKLKIQLEGEK